MKYLNLFIKRYKLPQPAKKQLSKYKAICSKSFFKYIPREICRTENKRETHRVILQSWDTLSDSSLYDTVNITLYMQIILKFLGNTLKPNTSTQTNTKQTCKNVAFILQSACKQSFPHFMHNELQSRTIPIWWIL